ncbi:alpha-2-macroglobulin [Candidimonas sp. SYP-B2681]|uniref:alpha-2-macroglobulin family protein n=1 Tax=Candidimonas sp. SYP-B2681 TaxID=2497686 RepID=UPI000F8795B0|nr:MG2 domain-containing protein [Candidimonas sp. SYP-B2681]RTZ41109.1 alpha-2-macroglobulin [Candidimonas sp. SYP-B2681]
MYRIKAAVLAWALSLSPAWGAQIVKFSPQGTVSVVESATLTFDTDVVAFGDDQAAAPVDVDCNDPDVKGDGRWLDTRRWSYVFQSPLAAGVSCTARVRSAFRTLANEVLGGKTSFAFQTGGPVVVDSRPYGSTIDEDQVFLLRFNGQVDVDTLLAHARCRVEGLGEAVPVRLITGEARTAILNTSYYSRAQAMDTAATQMLQCQRRLPAEARVQLVLGPGIATRSENRPAVASTKAKVLDYTVRPGFKATFSCQRENSSKPCTPVSSFSLEFSAPISRDQAERIRLKTPSSELAPWMGRNDTDRGDLSRIQFKGPFPELSSLVLMLPENLTDDAGRALVNADQFPLKIQTAEFPPLVKFAAAPFGVVERYADSSARGKGAQTPATLPLTLRNVESALSTEEIALSAGRMSDYAAQGDAEVLRWYARVRRLNESRWTANQLNDIMADRQPRSEDEPAIDARAFSALKAFANTRELVLPGISTDAVRPFEVIGVPIDEPGFHVLEVESTRLGGSLLSGGGPMYVRTTALVTNLGVHIKTGRDDILAWVTTLDNGLVVPNAAIVVLSCSGEIVAKGTTDENGIWHHRHRLNVPNYCEDTGLTGTYVSARIEAAHPMARGKADFSFAFSDWNRGIESWRFNVPTNTSAKPTVAAHTLFDRTLLRAGDTVSMKHFVRVQTRNGLALPAADNYPTKLIIEHQEMGQQYQIPLNWTNTQSGGVSATTSFVVPKTAKLGMYSVRMTDSADNWYGSAQFRVEEFKLPLLTGQLKISDSAGSGVLVAPQKLNADIQVSYVSGGAAAQLPVQLSAVLRERWLSFPEYEDYSFSPPDEREGTSDQPDTDSVSGSDQTIKQSLFLDKQALVLDRQGGGRIAITSLPAITRPQTMVFETSFSDPNGEIQTLAQSLPVWPAAIQAGVRADSSVQAAKPAHVSALALSPQGVPQADIAMAVTAVARTTYSTRKRMVGGFYSYDNHTEIRELGTVCEGKTNMKGELDCTIELDASGAVQLVARAKDAQGRESRAESTVWVMGEDDLWFGGGNDDRIDVIPVKKTWKSGEVAQFQVRMPFRHATALVAVEREGVLQTRVVRLLGKDPIISLPIEADWGPNVYVSVLALRGRLHKVPWYSFFTEGWQEPQSWYSAFVEASKNLAPPTALIDLAKPSFRFGLTEIRVSDESDQLHVKISTNKQNYRLREKAVVTLHVTTPDGKPAAYGTVAFAAVDQALLELAPNESWDVLSAMRQFRSYGVDTATAQMEIVGRRHYGRKAQPAGGGGGMSPTRELLDTLLLWKPDIQLDAEGKAQLSLPLNDSITRFKLVAVADFGSARFGTGSQSIASTQDLQIISGLPTVIREGDHYLAMASVRNSTERDMQLEVTASYVGSGVPDHQLAAQKIHLASGAAHTVSWKVQAPESTGWEKSSTLTWTFQVQEQDDSSANAASDKLLFNQTLIAAVPVTARQATLLPLESDAPVVSLPVSVPTNAAVDASGKPRGGLRVHVQSSLAGGLTGVQEWFKSYPYTCLEQSSSIAIGLRDVTQWQGIMHKLPDYLDADGLVSYFPGSLRGNEVLTAYLLTASHEAQALGLDFVIPEAIRLSMTRGLLAFVEGNITRPRWSPERDLDARKLIVLEALSRYRLVQPRMVDSIAIDPDAWPTSAVIDWMAILQRMPAIPNQKLQLHQAEQILRARLLVRGTTATFGDSAQNNWWWLMISPETNLAKLIMTTVGQPRWQEDLPRLAQGLLSLQSKGAWHTTTANLLGTLAIEKFAQSFEGTRVSGRVQVGSLAGGSPHIFDWPRPAPNALASEHDVIQAWPQESSSTLTLQQQGQGTVWAMVSSLAAVPVVKPVMAGYSISRSMHPISQALPGVWSRGDVYRVKLDIAAKTATTWAVLTDAIPAGATILGSGLGRDSSIATQTEAVKGWYAPSFVERSFEGYRAYYEYLPAGSSTIEYTVRLNTAGQFQLPPTRMEAMYQPDVYGELPHAGRFTVELEKVD